MSGSSTAYIKWLRQQQIIKAVINLNSFILRASRSVVNMGQAFDYLLTFAQEVSQVADALVTTRPEVTVSLLTRSLRLRQLLTDSSVSPFTGLPKKSEGLLLLRTMALWYHSKMMVAVVMFVCAVISTTLKFEGICSETSSSVATETATKLSQVTVGMFSSAAAFELVVLALTLLHGSKLRSSSHAAGKVVTAVTQGNIVYALSIFGGNKPVTSIANITFFVLPLHDGWNGLLATFQGVLHGVVATRILFNLRDAIHNRRDVFVFSMSRLQFAPVLKNGQNTNAESTDFQQETSTLPSAPGHPLPDPPAMVLKSFP
ncbi:hypothetical protein BS17DRAFT_818801 [Gyrodon lividus]|nr:hypothetical protein BS17DRAFT_818801 [Gyrodon lividus]